jgi:predicted small metal-binding protein
MAGIERIPSFEDEPQWLTEEDTKQLTEKIVSNMACKTYGFDCNFITKGEEVGKVIEEFREHTMKKHYIDYPEGVLLKFIMNKK